MKNILEEKKSDASVVVIITIAILLTSLAWISHIFSWAWVGNGFLLDIILLVVAILITIGASIAITKAKQRKNTKLKLDIEFEPTDKAQSNFTCFSCGEILFTKEGLCSACGSPKPVCIVCYSELHSEDSIVKMPCCSTYAHKEHVINFLEIKGHCPKCQQIFTENELEEIIT